MFLIAWINGNSGAEYFTKETISQGRAEGGGGGVVRGFLTPYSAAD